MKKVRPMGPNARVIGHVVPSNGVPSMAWNSPARQEGSLNPVSGVGVEPMTWDSPARREGTLNPLLRGVGSVEPMSWNSPARREGTLNPIAGIKVGRVDVDESGLMFLAPVVPLAVNAITKAVRKAKAKRKAKTLQAAAAAGFSVHAGYGHGHVGGVFDDADDDDDLDDLDDETGSIFGTIKKIGAKWKAKRAAKKAAKAAAKAAAEKSAMATTPASTAASAGMRFRRTPESGAVTAHFMHGSDMIGAILIDSDGLRTKVGPGND